MIKNSINQEAVTIAKVYVSNNRTLKYKKQNLQNKKDKYINPQLFLETLTLLSQELIGQENKKSVSTQKT